MSSISNSQVLFHKSSTQLSSGFSFKQSDLQVLHPTTLSFSPLRSRAQKHLIVKATYSDGGRSSSASLFVSGFVLGGLVVGTLGCVYAPQISKAIAGTDKKDLMRKLPKFIYDEEKALEKQRKILTEKIEQLNSAIDDVSSQLRPEGAPNGAAVNFDEAEGLEATI